MAEDGFEKMGWEEVGNNFLGIEVWFVGEDSERVAVRVELFEEVEDTGVGMGAEVPVVFVVGLEEVESFSGSVLL